MVGARCNKDDLNEGADMENFATMHDCILATKVNGSN